MSKNFQEIILTAATPAQSMVGMPGIISVSGVLDGATNVSVIPTHDEFVIANNVALLALTGANTSPVITNPVLLVSAPIAFNVQAERLTFRLGGAPGASTAITIRWFLVSTPY